MSQCPSEDLLLSFVTLVRMNFNKSWYVTSLNDIKQIGIMTFDLRGKGGQNGGQITKLIYDPS